MKGGVILFRGSGAAARRYVEADRSRADEYYLGADDAVAEYAALDSRGEVTATQSLTADEYEGWVDWIYPETGESMGTPRAAAEGTKGSPLFAEMTINAAKSLSVAAALHPEVSDALDAAQQDALTEIRRWLGQHSVTRVGPRDAREIVHAENMQLGQRFRWQGFEPCAWGGCHSQCVDRGLRIPSGGRTYAVVSGNRTGAGVGAVHRGTRSETSPADRAKRGV